MSDGESWAQAHALRQLFDQLSDAILLLDAQARISFANIAALRALSCESGMPVDQLRATLGDAAIDWLHSRIASNRLGRAHRGNADAPLVVLKDGRRVSLAWQPLDGVHSTLRLQIGLAASSLPTAPRGVRTPPVADLVHVLWQSPFPATLQDTSYRIVDVNQAYLDFSGFSRDKLIGIDPLQLQPEEDRPANLAARPSSLAALQRGEVLPLIERRIIDANGRERWFRAARTELQGDRGEPVYLVILQDSTAEHAARERADRSARELDDWFDLSPVGMVLYDEAGLLVRTNPAFDALGGEVPSLLSDASPSLSQLLAWTADGPSPLLQPGSSPVVGDGWVVQHDGQQRRLRSTVRCYQTPGGQRRYMAVVEDRSIE